MTGECNRVDKWQGEVGYIVLNASVWTVGCEWNYVRDVGEFNFKVLEMTYLYIRCAFHSHRKLPIRIYSQFLEVVYFNVYFTLKFGSNESQIVWRVILTRDRELMCFRRNLNSIRRMKMRYQILFWFSLNRPIDYHVRASGKLQKHL